MDNRKQQHYSKQVIEIADFAYKNPQCKTAELIALYCGKLRKKKRTIEWYIQQAKEYNRARIQRHEKTKDEVMVSKAKEAAKSGVLNRYECLIALSKIIKGEVRKEGDEVIIPSDSERVRAIQQLSKMQGWETERIDMTTNGDNINTNNKTEVIFRHYD